MQRMLSMSIDDSSDTWFPKKIPLHTFLLIYALASLAMNFAFFTIAHFLGWVVTFAVLYYVAPAANVILIFLGVCGSALTTYPPKNFEIRAVQLLSGLIIQVCFATALHVALIVTTINPF